MRKTLKIKKRIFIKLSVLCVVLLAVGGFFLYRYYRTSICQYCNVYYPAPRPPISPLPITPTPTYEVYPTIPQPTNIDESDWKTFTVPGKYTIKYPPTLKLVLNVWKNPPTDDVIHVDYPSTPPYCDIYMTIDSRKGAYDQSVDSFKSDDPNLEKIPYGYAFHSTDTTCGKKTYIVTEHLKKGDVEIGLSYSEYMNEPLLYSAVAKTLTFVH